MTERARETEEKGARDRQPGKFNTLRFQFTLVIFLLAFLPNAVLTLGAGRELRMLTGGGLGNSALSLGLWLITVAALSALMGWVLSGALLRPLSRLTGELARGEFEPTPSPAAGRLSDDPQEVRALRQAFGGLLARLSTEQERRGAFMATLVHDLKTPLVATGHLIRTLSSRPLPELERHALGEHLMAENARLLGLVQQMADAHRFEREDVSLTLADTDLRALLERVATRLRQGRVMPHVKLLVTGQGEAHVDAAVLERAVANLAENALRYARSHLELRVDEGGLSVCDDGPGLPAAASIESLAQPFNAQPVEIAGQKYTAGTAGLGLYIVRRIAEAHGGQLIYRREGADQADQEYGHGLTVMHLLLPDLSDSALSSAELSASQGSDGPAPDASSPLPSSVPLRSDTALLRPAPSSLEVHP
jgi:signal transduction histidine kinase